MNRVLFTNTVLTEIGPVINKLMLAGLASPKITEFQAFFCQLMQPADTWKLFDLNLCSEYGQFYSSRNFEVSQI